MCFLFPKCGLQVRSSYTLECATGYEDNPRQSEIQICHSEWIHLMEHTEELHPHPSPIRTEIRLENSKTWIEEETGPDFPWSSNTVYVIRSHISMSPLLPHLFIFFTLLTSFLFFLPAFCVNFSAPNFVRRFSRLLSSEHISCISCNLTDKNRIKGRKHDQVPN